MIIEMISGQVPKLIRDQFDHHQMCMEKRDLSVYSVLFMLARGCDRSRLAILA